MQPEWRWSRSETPAGSGTGAFSRWGRCFPPPPCRTPGNRGSLPGSPARGRAPFCPGQSCTRGRTGGNAPSFFQLLVKPGFLHVASLRGNENYHSSLLLGNSKWLVTSGNCKSMTFRGDCKGGKNFLKPGIIPPFETLPGISGYDTSKHGDGGRSSAGLAPGCGPGGRGFNPVVHPRNFKGLGLIGLTPLFLISNPISNLPGKLGP